MLVPALLPGFWPRVRGWIASARVVHPVQATVDEAGPDTESGRLRSESEPSRPGADHEHVDQPAGHDVTLRFATGAGAAACPPAPPARRCTADRTLAALVLVPWAQQARSDFA